VTGRWRECVPCHRSTMSITAGIMLALWIAGFAAGYGLRSYRSYRRRKRERLRRSCRLCSTPAFTPFENVGAGEPEYLPRVRTSPPTMVD
jgi:hypothetical protein